MNAVLPARRRADHFQSLVEGSSTSGRTDARYGELLELVGALRSTPAATPRPDFVTDLRGRLMTAAATELVSTGGGRVSTADAATPTRQRKRERRIAAAVGGLAALGATTSMAVAAQSALPGQPLYPIKRAIENAEAGLRTAEESKGATILQNASGRLDEVDQLTEDTGDADTINETLQAFTSQATEASDLLLGAYAHTGERQAIADLRQFTRESMAVLQALEGRVPAQARAALILAAQVLSQIDAQALQACPTCGGPAVVPAPELVLDAFTATAGDSRPEASPAAQRSPSRSHRSRQHQDNQAPSSADEGSASNQQASDPQSQPQLAADGGSADSSSDGSTTGTGSTGSVSADDGGSSNPLQDPLAEVVKDAGTIDGARSGLRDVVGGVSGSLDKTATTTKSLLP